MGSWRANVPSDFGTPEDAEAPRFSHDLTPCNLPLGTAGALFGTEFSSARGALGAAGGGLESSAFGAMGGTFGACGACGGSVAGSFDFWSSFGRHVLSLAGSEAC